MRVTLRSGAKINLGLAIGPVRPDGFHALATVYQTLALADGDADRITIELRERRAGEPPVTLGSNDPRVPLDGRNTVAKMLQPALAAPGRATLAVHVHIEKRLPVQGGLGAGSANAATALVGLERLLARAGAAPPLTGEERLRLAATVGSDVPLFLLGGAVLGLGRGEQVVPLPDIGSAADPSADPDPLHVVLALPAVGVSTPAAFREWDALEHDRGLTPEAAADRLGTLSRALAAAWCEPHASGVFAASGQDLAGTLLSTLVQTGILRNDFEQVVFRQHPFLEQIKRVLAGESSVSPVSFAALSGSGSALFGLYPTAAAADQAQERLNRMEVRTTRARLQHRRTYWNGMVREEQ